MSEGRKSLPTAIPSPSTLCTDGVRKTSPSSPSSTEGSTTSAEAERRCCLLGGSSEGGEFSLSDSWPPGSSGAGAGATQGAVSGRLMDLLPFGRLASALKVLAGAETLGAWHPGRLGVVSGPIILRLGAGALDVEDPLGPEFNESARDRRALNVGANGPRDEGPGLRRLGKGLDLDPLDNYLLLGGLGRGGRLGGPLLGQPSSRVPSSRVPSSRKLAWVQLRVQASPPRPNRPVQKQWTADGTACRRP